MPSVELITIGTEILLGEIADTNSQYLAQELRNVGIDLFRITSVGDNVKRIAQAIKDSLNRCDIVITTGGLGPTVDDPTREAVALALGVDSEFRPELWEQIKSRFQKLGRIPTENNRRQAYVPSGAVPVENPVGTAPIFIMQLPSQVVISLPGVPSEMKFLMKHKIIPYLRQHYDLHSILKLRVLHTVGVGESQIDDLIGDLEQLSNPTVGLAAHSGQVDVRITVKASSEEEALSSIQPLEKTLRERLGDSIYGVDQDTLEEIALRSLSANHWTIAIAEAGLGGNVVRRLAVVGKPFIGGHVLADFNSKEQFSEITNAYRSFQQADVAVGVAIQHKDDAFEVFHILLTPNNTSEFTRRYGGPPEYAPLWAFNQTMDLIRRISHDS